MRILPLASLACILAPFVEAQAPSTWTREALPTAFQPGNVHQRGKILTYRDQGEFRAYSALTRSWAKTPISATAQVRIANDLALIVDGDRVTAFASYTGAFRTVRVSASRQVLNPSTQKNDSIVLVQDGATLWAFSGFTGQWVSRTTTPSAVCSVQRHTAILVETNSVLGMSAFRGTWTSQPTTGSLIRTAADGTVGVVETSTHLHGFSALHNSWTARPRLPGNATFRVADDLAVWSNQVSYVGFSGLRGSFAEAVTGVRLTLDISDQLVAAHQGSSFWFYSACTGAWSNHTFASTPTLTMASGLALLVEPQTAHGYSAPLGRIASTPCQTVNWQVSGTVAATIDGAHPGHLYSAIAGRWATAPAHATTDLPRVSLTGALIPSTTGWIAYSARSASFLPLTARAGSAAHADPTSAVMAVTDGDTLSVFEPRSQRWLQQAFVGNLQVLIWRTCMVAVDGAGDAYGFGSFHGQIERHALGGTPLEFHASSESGRIATQNSILAFTTVPLLSTPWQFPEFRRTFTAGSELDIHLSAAASSGRAYVALALQPPVALPGLGTLHLDSSQLVLIPRALDTTTGTARASFPVPNVPGIRGVEVFMQALVLPHAGTPYVTAPASVMVF